jgi:hypothetical protein
MRSLHAQREDSACLNQSLSFGALLDALGLRLAVEVKAA